MKRSQPGNSQHSEELPSRALFDKTQKKSSKRMEAVGIDSMPTIKIVDLPSDTSREIKKFVQRFEKQNISLKTQLETRESSFNELLELVSDAIVMVDSEFNILQFNTNFERLSGYTIDELKKKSFPHSFFLKMDRQNIEKSILSIGDSKPAKVEKKLEVDFVRKDGSRLPVEMEFSRNNEHGDLFVRLRDISEMRQCEREISQRKQELSILSAISKSIKRPKNLNKNIQLALANSCQLVGFDRGVICLGDSGLKNLQPFITSGITRVIAEKIMERYFDLILQVKNEKKIITMNSTSTFLAEILSRQPKCRSVALVPLSLRRNYFGVIALGSMDHIEFDSDKKQLLTAIGHQLSIHIENTLLFRELETKTHEVETKNKELNSFVSTVSHDLKTPIIALHGFLGLFKEKYGAAIDKEGTEYLDRVFRNAEYMEKMINDLLRLSRAGRVLGAKRKCSTRKLVNEIIMGLSPRMEEKGIQCVVSNSLPVIYGDKNRLQTVFENLIVNAMKYSSPERPGTIEICCKVKRKVYQFSVKDNGIGIETENHERIFEVFQKCTPHSETSEGTGVGLTIVKKIIEHHDGRVWVESRLNRGATFFFTLPKESVKRKKMGQ